MYIYTYIDMYLYMRERQLCGIIAFSPRLPSNPGGAYPVPPKKWDHQKNKRVIKTISYNQARKPIYNTSVKSFKDYENYLSKLKNLN